MDEMFNIGLAGIKGGGGLRKVKAPTESRKHGSIAHFCSSNREEGGRGSTKDKEKRNTVNVRLQQTSSQ